MKFNHRINNQYIIYVLIVVVQFLISSLHNNYLSVIEVTLIYWIIFARKINSYRIIIIIILMFAAFDMTTYHLVGQQGLIFFASYAVLSLLEKYAPFLTKGFSFLSGIIFLLTFLIINGFVNQEFKIEKFIINLIVFCILKLIYNITVVNEL